MPGLRERDEAGGKVLRGVRGEDLATGPCEPRTGTVSLLRGADHARKEVLPGVWDGPWHSLVLTPLTATRTSRLPFMRGPDQARGEVLWGLWPEVHVACLRCRVSVPSPWDS